MSEFKEERKRLLSKLNPPKSCKTLVYWMTRDQRVHDNWAMLYAQKLALTYKSKLLICFCVPETTFRQHDFMIKGLQEMEVECQKLNIPFYLLKKLDKDTILEFVELQNAELIVTDFYPLRTYMNVASAVAEKIPLIQVDAHNIVPCWIASNKVEVGARTLRPKINARLKEYLTDFPPMVYHQYNNGSNVVDWNVEVDQSVKPVKWAQPGYKAGMEVFRQFTVKKLSGYSTDRNDPCKDGVSNLSPWFHFGQISPQRIALECNKIKNNANKVHVESFLEEMVVRRELSDNFCFYNPDYDSLKGASAWVRETLRKHQTDKREYVYRKQELEDGKTHDALWNAAQHELVKAGKMHGYMRMYWAKKILEWTSSPEEALDIAITLNDKYELDGQDPNGFVGCMWSIAGVHDRGWTERPIFGKIRYMNYNGCARKFDVSAYIKKCKSLS